MTDRHIIFSPPMIRALLREVEAPGTGKTETRRFPHAWLRWSDERGTTHAFTPALWAQATTGMDGLRRVEFEPRRYLWRWSSDPLPHQGVRSLWIVYPIVQPGDRLWVRENFYLDDDGDNEFPVYATDQRAVAELLSHPDSRPHHKKLRPSIHMPRWASRITLTVTEVRRERLQAIDNADARAEGVDCWPDFVEGRRDPFPVTRYRDLWAALHGMESWDANPEVVVLTFAVALRNIDAAEAIRLGRGRA